VASCIISSILDSSTGSTWNQFGLTVNTYSGIINTDSGSPQEVFRFRGAYFLMLCLVGQLANLLRVLGRDHGGEKEHNVKYTRISAISVIRQPIDSTDKGQHQCERRY